MKSGPDQAKSYSPPEGRIALPANERIVEFLDCAIQAKSAYAHKLPPDTKSGLFCYIGNCNKLATYASV